MTGDDLNAPLGLRPARRRRNFPIAFSHVVAAGLALFLGLVVIWAFVAENPFGGGPIVKVPIDWRAGVAKTPDGAVAVEPTADQAAVAVHEPDRYDGPSGGSVVRPGGNAAPASSKTVTIIDGKTGARQEIVIPDLGNDANSVSSQPAKQKSGR